MNTKMTKMLIKCTLYTNITLYQYKLDQHVTSSIQRREDMIKVYFVQNQCIHTKLTCMLISKSTKITQVLLIYLHFQIFTVESVKEVWRDLRDYYRKELKIISCPPAKRKSGSKRTGLMDTVERWKFYERMSFYKPYLYLKE